MPLIKLHFSKQQSLNEEVEKKVREITKKVFDVEDNLVIIFMLNDLSERNKQILLELEMKSSHKDEIDKYVSEIKNTVSEIKAISIKVFNDEDVYFKDFTQNSELNL